MRRVLVDADTGAYMHLLDNVSQPGNVGNFKVERHLLVHIISIEVCRRVLIAVELF